MRKIRYSFLALAALVAAGALLAVGCKQPGGSAGDNGGGTTTPGGNQGGTQQEQGTVDTGDAVELTGKLGIGTLTMSIQNGSITAHFHDSRNGKVYTGNGKVAKGGKVAMKLAAVDNTSDTIPFEGTYKNGVGFELTKLTDTYPYKEVELIKPYQGTEGSIQSEFVRYVHDLDNPYNSAEKLSAVFFITLKDDKALITAVYGNDHIGMRSVSKDALLEGNKVNVMMTIAGVSYRVELTFNEDQRGNTRSTDERTVWYLGKKNPKYDSDASKPGNKYPEYIGGLRLFKQEAPKDPSTPLLEDKVLVHQVFNLYDTTAKKLGTLELTIRGYQVEYVLTQAGGLGEDSGKRQVRRVMLKKKGVRKGLLDSEVLEAARVKSGGATSIDVVETHADGTYGNSKTVFVFRNKTDTGAAATAATHTYNTYDFQVIEFDPANYSFYLRGKYLSDKNLAANAGKQLAGTSDGTDIVMHKAIPDADKLEGDLLQGE